MERAHDDADSYRRRAELCLRLYEVFEVQKRIPRIILLVQTATYLRRADELGILMANSRERGPYNQVPKTKDSLALLLSQPNTRWYESKMRMSMQCFDYLVQLLSTDEVFVRKPTGRPQRAVREQVAIFLQYMGDPRTKLESAVNTGIGEGSIYHYVDRVADALYHMLPQVIRWPTGAEAARVADAFEVDNCVGATVDDKKRFTSVDGGFTGVRHDSDIFRKSQIWRRRDVYSALKNLASD
ncbi:BQ5605_C003g01890 [Microbotryum silenes-dioicae]|uniref:BQ5605_C003g01890 protein n=1 Tax=Microbotryum silenes-dioicae TaxID=796604 RepID=A0A2X0P2S2_9BASI|nr:BQ5605_C003g01890 [Microbotryum silenes-dioicae]